MSAGVSVSLLMTFLLFPALQLQFNKLMPNLSFENRFSLTLVFSRFTDRYGNGILWFSALLLIISMIGGTRLMVENSFIDYFKESTEIYQGLKVIDQKLGGTTTLDVVLNFEDDEEPEEVSEEPANPDADEEESEEFEDFSEFEEEIEAEEGEAQYWFTSYRMEQLEALHNYLDEIPETGKVLSLATLLKVGRTINDGKPLDNFMLALVYNELPEEVRKIILTPYVAVEENQARVSVRIRDSQPDLRRNELIKKIRR